MAPAWCSCGSVRLTTMSDHVRAQLRANGVEVLKGLPTTLDNVFPGRTWPLKADHPPSLLVYTGDERSDTAAAQGVLGRELTFAVEGRVVSSSPPDDLLDQIALEVEPAMTAQPLLGGLALEVTLSATRSMTQSQ